ncbi:hypothetical protein SORBI_3006G275300 [Sorghum bicolor]|jgi:hypothetical protein|uniref:VQ domain-containing protein n=1 Tax=Sorghum bicolor TaxID=4558 RepID=A0A1Z5RFV3_SORBI|nr:hypothetical protein SORBI_3006G275300 [Sorghum bicolor]
MASRSSSSMTEPAPLLQRHHELQLQGPRPAPLKVSTSTTGAEMVVKKRRLHQAPPRQPVIIYVESPRVVHAHPAEFKSVVQRLTGAPAAPAPSPPRTMVFSASAPPPLQLQFPFQFPLVGAAGSAGPLLPLTSSIMSAVTVADASGSSSVQENLSSDPFLLPLPSSSLAACYHQHHAGAGGDLFIAHHQ